MGKARVLVVEDDETYLKVIEDALHLAGYDVTKAKDGMAALEMMGSERPDLVLLDIRLPDISGFDVCRRIRLSSQVPIIMLTAVGEEKYRVRGLDLGADDYITKPFGVDELLARIRANLRRAEPAAGSTTGEPQTLEFGPLKIDSVQQRVFLGDREVVISTTEFALLWQLAINAGKVMGHEALLKSVWGVDSPEITTRLKVNISRLRRKLEKNPRNPQLILTRSGVGYLFSPDNLQ